MELSSKNYFSKEADKEYWSVSQVKSFKSCEAKAMAKIKGEWVEGKNDAFLLGSYVHSWNESSEAFEEFIKEHPEMFSSRGATKGQLKSEFQLGNRMIETLANDPLVTKVREGQKEVVMTANLFGKYPFKIMIDIFNPDRGVIADLKTTKGIHEKYYDGGTRKNFIEFYDYFLQMAAYCEVVRLNTGLASYMKPHIIAVSKEPIPDKAVIYLGTDFIPDKLLELECMLIRYDEVKKGTQEPMRCEHCDYCRATKKLSKVLRVEEL